MDYQRQAAVRQMQCSSFLPNTVLLNQLTKLSFKFSDSLFSAISIIAIDRHAYAKKEEGLIDKNVMFETWRFFVLSTTTDFNRW